MRDADDAGRAAETLAGLACGEIRVDGRVIEVPVFDLEGKVPEAVRQLDAAGVEVVDVAARHSTLDDVFFALTGTAAEDAEQLQGAGR